MTNSQESTIENAKLIVSILNEMKLRSYTFSLLTDLTKSLKEKGCPYPGSITAYLHRQNLVIEKGNWYTFLDKKPFDFYNFICVVDRIKAKNNKLKRKPIEKIVVEKKIRSEIKPQHSKWTRFWAKFLFKIVL